MWYLLSRIIRIPIRLVDRLSELTMRLTLQWLVPTSLHRYVRDSGGFRTLGDVGAYSAALSICLISPQLVRQYYRLREKMQVFDYSERYHRLTAEKRHDDDLKGQDHNMFLEVIPCQSDYVHKNEDSPVLLFVHGGGWGSGRPWQYSLAAHNMGLLLHASKVILLAYPYYPEASILQQRDAVLAALHYVREHREELGIGSQQAVVLTGHSSGANISALALLQHYLEEEEEAEAEEKMKLRHEGLGEASLHQHHHPLVEMFIGLSGIYNTENQYNHEQDRGVHDLSPLRPAIGPEEHFLLCSPSSLVQNRVLNSVQGKSITSAFPMMALIHGEDDLTVPWQSSEDFERAVRNLLIDKDMPTVLSYYPEYGHMSPIVDLLYQGTWNDTKSAISDAFEHFQTKYRLRLQ